MSTKYFPFEITQTPYKPSMGAKPLDLRSWIEIDSTYKEQITQKKNILKNHLDLVFVAPDILNAAILETQDLLANHLIEFFPSQFAIKNSKLHTPMGDSFEITNNPSQALLQMSQWVQEDIAFLNPTSPVRLCGGCVCFPSRWNLPQKVNKTSDEIHEPVPQYKETIAKPTRSFLEKIQTDKPIWRLNWTIHDCPKIFTPFPEEGRTDLTRDNVIESTFIRMERQTLRRLQKTEFILFTIRTYILPVATVAQNPLNRMALQSTLQHLPLETAHYKGMKGFFQVLKDALA